VFGPTRLLWGTGYPGVAREFYKRPTLAEELTLVREKIPFFTADDRQKILGENAAAIWKLQA
jgi:predicted TIM-barrel fold metal-dependent hydrolase